MPVFDDWTRVCWWVLHTFAAAFPESKDVKGESKPVAEERRKSFEQLMKDFAENFPCPVCGVHLKDYLKEHPIYPATESRALLEAYIYELHEAVNKRKGKPQMHSLEQVKEAFDITKPWKPFGGYPITSSFNVLSANKDGILQDATNPTANEKIYLTIIIVLAFILFIIGALAIYFFFYISMAELVLKKGDWTAFLEDIHVDTIEYFDLSDDEEKEMMEDEYNKRLKAMKGIKTPEIDSLPSTRKSNRSSKKKRSGKSVSFAGDENYTEPSNRGEVSYAERKIISLTKGKSNSLLSGLTNVEDMGFRLNNRKTDVIDKEIDEELNRVRDVLNDPAVRIEGTCIILNIPQFAKKRDIDSAIFKRQMYPEELRQANLFTIPGVSPLVERMAKEIEHDKKQMNNESNQESDEESDEESAEEKAEKTIEECAEERPPDDEDNKSDEQDEKVSSDKDRNETDDEFCKCWNSVGFKYLDFTSKDQAIKWAVQKGNFRMVDLLLQNPTVDPSVYNQYAIRTASEDGHFKIVEKLLVHSRVDPSVLSQYALRYACFKGHIQVVELLLLDDRVDPSVEHQCAFCWACEAGHFRLVKRLLQDPRVDHSTYSKYAVQWAPEKYGYVEIIEKIMEDMSRNTCHAL